MDEIRVYQTNMPDWLHHLAEMDAIDTIMGMVGYPLAYAFGDIPGLLLWTGTIAGVTLLRKTPIVPASLRLVIDLFQRPKVVRGQFRDVVLPVMREDQPMENHNWVNDPSEEMVHAVADLISPTDNDPLVVMPVKPAPNSVRALVNAYQRLDKLPALPGLHIVIFGPTGSGKSSIIKALVRHHQDAVLLIGDPHYVPGNWPARAYVVGKGRNFAEIAGAIRALVVEMNRRYRAAAEGRLNLTTVQPIYFVADELSALAENEPQAMAELVTLAQEGRKAKVFVIMTPHGQQVKTMGLEGRGDARENFAFIAAQRVPEKFKPFPRIVSVTLGPPKSTDNEKLGYFVVPSPTTYTGIPTFGLPSFLQTGVSQGVPELEWGVPAGVPETGKGVPAPVPERALMGVPGVRHTPGTGFSTRFGRDSAETPQLIASLVQYGFGLRKISSFLPFANDDARNMTKDALRIVAILPERPAAGSAAEIDLVRYLHLECGAPLERIANLLNGNQWENLARISEATYAQRDA